MRVFYCYSIPLKEYLESNNILPINKEYETNPNSGKKYWRFQKGEQLDYYLSIWKNNKIKAIQLLKNK